MSSPNKSNQIVKYDKNKLSNLSCKLVKNVHDYFGKEYACGGFLDDPYKVYLRTSKAVQVNKTTVSRIIRERAKFSESGCGKVIFKTPGKNRTRDCSKRDVNCFVMDQIRHMVYSYYNNSQLPCIMSLTKELKENGLITAGHSTLRRILFNMGFRFRRYSGRRILLEKGDISIKRCQFLKNMSKQNFDNIVWIGETCFFTSQRKYWEKNAKVIIFHAGTSKGFIKNVLKVQLSNDMRINLEKEISTDVFTKWFEHLLENIPQNSTIVLNTLACHNADLSRPPNIYSQKKEILDWLENINISCEGDLHKAELLDLVNMAKPILPNYALEHIASERGHTVIRVPPVHNHFNAIETIWLKLKDDVKEKSSSPNGNIHVKELETITRSSLEDITEKDWCQAVNNAKETILKAKSNEHQLETSVETLFRHIDATKKSGREDLEVLRDNEDSYMSDYLSDTDTEENEPIETEEFHEQNTEEEGTHTHIENIYNTVANSQNMSILMKALRKEPTENKTVNFTEFINLV